MRRTIVPAVLAVAAVLATARAQDVERDTGACTPDTPANCSPLTERITDFHSHVVVGADGMLTVTETIAVVAAGEQIKRGIYRDFPTDYTTDVSIGDLAVPILHRQVPFEVLAVRRDGNDEPYHTESEANGVRVYFGSADVMLPPGPHTYTFTYRTGRQLGFFADHDELYWNATGNGWAFLIERASATVLLPPQIPRDRVTLEGYTGPQGSTDRNLQTAVEPNGQLEFASTVPLGSYEGLTIVASFPTGFIERPSEAQLREELLRENPVLLIAPAGMALVLLYYAATWLMVGRDPERGTIIPLFTPPLDLDAAGIRYVSGMRYDERCFTAALVGLAVKGWARIAEDDGSYTIASTSERHTPIGPAERKMNVALLNGGSIELKQKNHSRIRSAIRSLKQALEREYQGKMFRANRKWLLPGLGLSALIILIAGFSGSGAQSFAFGLMMIWLTGWTFACYHLLGQMWRGWRNVFRPGAGVFNRIGSVVIALITTAFTLPFVLAEVFALGMLSQVTSALMVPLMLVIVGLNSLFYYLLKQPTAAGRTIMDQIEGFKMYLTTAEGAELAQAAPAKTPQLYERLLPYAIALEVENEWAAQFASVLQEAAQSGNGQGYQPRWYTGSSFGRFGPTGFASAFSSSLGTSISSSSVAPGSSSGRSGGGSSGGGGGGGGGGGW